MSRIKAGRSVLAGLLSGTVMFSAFLTAPEVTLMQKPGANAAASDSGDNYYHDTFEADTDGWEGRGASSAAVSTASPYEGNKALLVTGRGSSWHGAMKALGNEFKSGSEYSFSVQASGSGNIMLSLQYKDASGETKYDHIANGRSSGEYVQLANTNYTLPDGSDFILYVETEAGTEDFSIDDFYAAKAGTQVGTGSSAKTFQGDLNGDGKVDAFDLALERKYLVSYMSASAEGFAMEAADVDGDGDFAVNDLVVLAKFLLGQVTELPKPTTTTTTTTSTVTTTTTAAASADYMASIRDQVTPNVPSSALAKAEGGVEHITYFSKKANRNKGANVWLPPGYDKNKKYPVFYVNHGYGGDENAMVNGMGVREIATNLIKSGEAEPMIIVFTNQYTDPQHDKQTGNGQADVPGYDNFVEDLPDSLMPYIESHYPVKTGRENTAVAGFSMGGRESLYIGIKCCDKVGYIGAGAPAPGIFPTKDQFMNHPGVMSKDDMRIDPPYSPYLLMIAGGTNDGMVNDYPKQYSDLFTQHGTENIYLSVPGGGHDSKTVIPLMYNFIKFLFKA
jgi:glucuronoarabinoxylan endo-1,4-beta-xylanase